MKPQEKRTSNFKISLRNLRHPIDPAHRLIYEKGTRRQKLILKVVFQKLRLELCNELASCVYLCGNDEIDCYEGGHIMTDEANDRLQLSLSDGLMSDIYGNSSFAIYF